MAKPAGLCNLDCTYCYYLHKQDLLPKTPASRLSDELLEEFIRQCIAGQDVDSVVFTWHGGEPTLLGQDFYRKAVELQQKYAKGKEIRNDLQTNGLLLDESWCEFLKGHDFRVGLSIDGPKEMHDFFRRSKDGSLSFDAAFQAARLLRQYGVRFGAMAVVNSVTARHPVEVYRFLTEELGSQRVQWLPCVEPKTFRTIAPGRWNAAEMPIMGTPAARPGHSTSVVTDWSVDPDDWGEFLCRTFDLWRKDGMGKVRLNWFDSVVDQWMGRMPRICVFAEVCGRSLAIEKDGSIYACDHFVYPEYRRGNLAGRSWGDAEGDSPIFAGTKPGQSPRLPTWPTLPSSAGSVAASAIPCQSIASGARTVLPATADA